MAAHLGDADFEPLAPRFRWMRDYLKRVAPPGRLAGIQHLDMELLREVLRFVNFVAVLREGAGGGDRLRFRFRIIGAVQGVIAGRDITGKFVEEAVLPGFVDRIRGNMTTAVERAAPVYDAFAMPHPARDFIDSERVYYPLAGDGEHIDQLLVLSAYPGNPEFDALALPPLPPPRGP
jgi:hypothetical protein